MNQMQSQPQPDNIEQVGASSRFPLETLSGQSASVQVFLFGSCEIQQLVAAKGDHAWERRSSARSLLKLLLCAPQRQAPKAQLAGILWPETEESKARESLRAAARALTKVLSPAGEKLLEAPQREVLKLADQAHVWADIDAFEQAVRIASEAATPQEAIAWWQHAHHLVRGEFLADDQLQPWIKHSWIKRRRQALWMARCRAIRSLADLHLQHENLSKAEEILEKHVALFPSDQDALARLLTLLIKQGCLDEAHALYQRSVVRLASLGKHPSGQIKEIMQFAAESTSTSKSTFAAHDDSGSDSQTHTQESLFHEMENHSATDGSISPATQGESQVNTGIISRRQVLQHAWGLGSTTLITPSEDMLSSVLDRFAHILTSPSHLDTSTLHYLERQNRNYWLDRQSASVASCDLLSYAWDHLQKILKLLEGSLQPNSRQHLCALASKTAQLVGELLLDMSYYDRGRQFHQTAIIAAREACDPTLEAIAWGRKGLAWIYEKQLSEALTCAQKARTLTSHPTVNAWLAAIEAEAHAGLAYPEDCLRALDAAATLNLSQSPSDDLYLIHFDHALLRGYQGACYRRLYHAENPQSHVFSRKAQDVLLEALLRLDVASVQRRPTFLIDLADTYVQQEEVEAACAKAIEAITLASQMKLQKVLLRALPLQQQLHPWKDTLPVRLLEEHIATILPANTTR